MGEAHKARSIRSIDPKKGLHGIKREIQKKFMAEQCAQLVAVLDEAISADGRARAGAGPRLPRDLLACDFFVTVTATFRRMYVFVVLDVGTRRLLHWNVTEHPTAEWTVQQFRTCITGESAHRFLVHDHDTIYSQAMDRT